MGLHAEIISTGTELLLGKTLNTNVFYLTGQLTGLGLEVNYHTTVGDNKDRLIEAVQQAFQRSEMVFLTGGLGPTADDLTKEIIALGLGLKMSFSEDSMNSIENYYDHKSPMPPSSEKQAFFPEGAEVLPNDLGTAPGAIIEKDGKYCVILPGPPSEMRPMFENYVLPKIQGLLGNSSPRLYVRTLKVFGLGESELEQAISDLMHKSSPFITLLDKHTYMDLRVTVRSSNEELARNMLDQTEAVIRGRLGNKVFGIDEETHSLVVGKLLRQQKLTLATAESCSGGLLGGRITDEAGRSDYYLGGVVSYANTAKQNLLGVNAENLFQYGAVSEVIAKEMAEGVRLTLGADLGLSTTGIAGPGGGTKDKPVGLVYIALAHAKGVIIERKQFVGNRNSIRNMTVEAALNLLREFLLNKD
jgi:nicotinamide-nucleotide amidase